MERANSNNSSLLILHNTIIFTMDPQSRVFRDGAIVIDNDRIKAIGQSSHILSEFSPLANQIVDLHGQFLLPGLINTHIHSSQQLARGIADDVDLMTWLHDRIWPYESNMTEEDSYISTLLCGIELIHSGVTCFAEAGGQHVSGMVRAVELLGLRACLTESTMDSATLVMVYQHLGVFEPQMIVFSLKRNCMRSTIMQQMAALEYGLE